MTTAFETRIAELLDQQAAQEQPPVRVSVDAAIQRGNSRLRWRWAGLAGAPVLAAAAVLAIALAGIVPLGGHTPRPAAGKSGAPKGSNGLAWTAAGPARARPLPVLTTGTSFGWLPAGDRFLSGNDNPAVHYMNIYAGRTFTWQLARWAPGACTLTSARSRLSCSFGGDTGSHWYLLAGAGPVIGGHQAFWAHSGSVLRQQIVWEYAPGAWAGLNVATRARQPVAALLRIAREISFGPASGQPLRFDFQLTDVPGSWRPGSVTYGARGGALLASQVQILGPKGDYGTPIVFIQKPSSCYFYPHGQSAHAHLRGYDVVVTAMPADGGRLGFHQLCAPDVEGASVLISMNEIGVRTPAMIFEHMRFFGSNPAAWVANPVG